MGYYFVKFCVADNARCAALDPKWDAVAEQMRGKTDLHWVSVDCVEHEDLCHAESAYPYPTLWVYRNGKRVYNYANVDASEEDLRLFALQLEKRGDGDFSSYFEKATPDRVADLEAPLSDVDKMAARGNCQFREYGGIGRGGPDGDACGPVTAADLCAEADSPPAWVPNMLSSGVDASGQIHVDVLTQKYECYECDLLQLTESPEDRYMYVDCNEHRALCYIPYIGQANSLRIRNLTKGAEGRPPFWYEYRS